MFQTIEAIVEKDGKVRLLEAIDLPCARRALITLLDESENASAFSGISETVLLSEASLATDWNRPEEDEAWSHLQPVP